MTESEDNDVIFALFYHFALTSRVLIIRLQNQSIYTANATNIKGKAVIAVLANSPFVPNIDSNAVDRIKTPKPNLIKSAFFFYINTIITDNSSIIEAIKLCKTVMVKKNSTLLVICDTKIAIAEFFLLL